MLPDGLLIEKNTEKLNQVLKVFSINMNKKIEYLNSFEEEVGD